MKSVEELDAIHREWMALDPCAIKSEKDRVFRLMRDVPSNMINCSADKSTGVVHVGSQPMAATPWPIDQCVLFCKARGYRTDIAWCGSKGEWVNL
jgi:hypothetical protein